MPATIHLSHNGTLAFRRSCKTFTVIKRRSFLNQHEQEPARQQFPSPGPAHPRINLPGCFSPLTRAGEVAVGVKDLSTSPPVSSLRLIQLNFVCKIIQNFYILLAEISSNYFSLQSQLKS